MWVSKYAKKIRTKVTSRPYNKEFLTTSCFPLAYVYDTPMLSTALTALHIILYLLTILDNSQQAVYLSCDGHIGGILTDSLVIASKSTVIVNSLFRPAFLRAISIRQEWIRLKYPLHSNISTCYRQTSYVDNLSAVISIGIHFAINRILPRGCVWDHIPFDIWSVPEIYEARMISVYVESEECWRKYYYNSLTNCIGICKIKLIWCSNS